MLAWEQGFIFSHKMNKPLRKEKNLQIGETLVSNAERKLNPHLGVSLKAMVYFLSSNAVTGPERASVRIGRFHDSASRFAITKGRESPWKTSLSFTGSREQDALRGLKWSTLFTQIWLWFCVIWPWFSSHYQKCPVRHLPILKSKVYSQEIEWEEIVIHKNIILTNCCR